MKEVFGNVWLIQVIFVIAVQLIVLVSAKTSVNKIRFAMMTGILLIPIVGMIYVLLVATQAFRSVPESWAGNHSVFDSLAEGYEDA